MIKSILTSFSCFISVSIFSQENRNIKLLNEQLSKKMKIEDDIELQIIVLEWDMLKTFKKSGYVITSDY